MNAENNHKRADFEVWLEQCESEAMRSEWCIDPDWPRWNELYSNGATPAQAVDELFKEVRAEGF